MKSEITPQEIKRIRGKYGLTQRAFARVLGIGDASIVRYENGQKPSKAIANLIRAADNKEFMLGCLRRSDESVSEDQLEKAKKIIYSEVTFDEKGEIMDINQIYELTLQREILNEQAAEILGDIFWKRFDAEENEDLAKVIIYKDIEWQLWLAKNSILNADTEIELAEVRGRILGLNALSAAVDKKAA